MFFPICQLRVVRFYKSSSPPSSPPPPPPLPPPPRRPPRSPDRTGHCRTSMASPRQECALPDLNRELKSAVGTADPQPGAPDRSGQRRTPTARKNVRRYARQNAGKNVRTYAIKIARENARTFCHQDCQIECQNICQIECQIERQIQQRGGGRGGEDNFDEKPLDFIKVILAPSSLPKKKARNNINRSARNYVRLIGHGGDHSKKVIFFSKYVTKGS